MRVEGLCTPSLNELLAEQERRRTPFKSPAMHHALTQAHPALTSRQDPITKDLRPLGITRHLNDDESICDRIPSRIITHWKRNLNITANSQTYMDQLPAHPFRANAQNAPENVPIRPDGYMPKLPTISDVKKRHTTNSIAQTREEMAVAPTGRAPCSTLTLQKPCSG